MFSGRLLLLSGLQQLVSTVLFFNDEKTKDQQDHALQKIYIVKGHTVRSEEAYDLGVILM